MEEIDASSTQPRTTEDETFGESSPVHDAINHEMNPSQPQNSEEGVHIEGLSVVKRIEEEMIEEVIEEELYEDQTIDDDEELFSEEDLEDSEEEEEVIEEKPKTGRRIVIDELKERLLIRARSSPYPPPTITFEGQDDEEADEEAGQETENGVESTSEEIMVETISAAYDGDEFMEETIHERTSEEFIDETVHEIAGVEYIDETIHESNILEETMHTIEEEILEETVHSGDHSLDEATAESSEGYHEFAEESNPNIGLDEELASTCTEEHSIPDVVEQSSQEETSVEHEHPAQAMKEESLDEKNVEDEHVKELSDDSAQPVEEQEEKDDDKDLLEDSFKESEQPEVYTEEPSVPEEKSVLHELLQAGEWKSLLVYLEKLRNEEASLIRSELTRVDGERKATPIHMAVWKAPLLLTKHFVSTIPSDYQEEILTKQDIDGNTPLHLACANLELKIKDNTLFDASVIKTLTLGAPSAHEIMNHQGDCPLALLLTSPAMRADSNRTEAEAAAEDLVKSILEKQPHLVSTQNINGKNLLHAAAGRGAHERVLMTLLEVAGPTCAEQPDDDGRLPLHYAASCISGKCPSVVFVEKLVEAYPEAIIHPGNTGDTPLHLLVSNIQTKIIDKEERSSQNVRKIALLLLGSSDHESMCPLLVKNQESVGIREITVFAQGISYHSQNHSISLSAITIALLRTVQCTSPCSKNPDAFAVCSESCDHDRSKQRDAPSFTLCLIECGRHG
jgi:ankyrin repeat protein